MVMERHYSISFTTSALRAIETLKIATLFIELRDWNKVREMVLEENILQQRTSRSMKKLYQELSSRLRCLTIEEIQLLLASSEEEQKQLLWLALCRRYDFIYDFAIEVIREKVINLHFKLDAADFDAFWTSKTVTDDELDKVASSTKQKARQIVFQMLREVDIIDQNNSIQLAQLPSRVIEILKDKATQDLALFPLAHMLMHR